MGQVELPAMAVSETFMKPSSMLYRNFLAMQVRRLSLCRPFCRSKAVILQAILQVRRLSLCWPFCRSEGCQFAGSPSSSLLNRLLKGEGGCSRVTQSNLRRCPFASRPLRRRRRSTILSARLHTH